MSTTRQTRSHSTMLQSCRGSLGHSSLQLERALYGNIRQFIRDHKDAPPSLGSATYEIISWEEPFAGLEDDDVEKKFASEEFPDLASLLAGSIVHGC